VVDFSSRRGRAPTARNPRNYALWDLSQVAEEPTPPGKRGRASHKLLSLLTPNSDRRPAGPARIGEKISTFCVLAESAKAWSQGRPTRATSRRCSEMQPPKPLVLRSGIEQVARREADERPSGISIGKNDRG
jgi:hypothetical protein